MMKRIILILLFACLAGICHAQDNRVFIPPDMGEVRTHTFTVPELQVSSAFIDSLNAILFSKKYGIHRMGTSMRYFHLSFEQKDSLNYSFQVLLEQDGGLNSKGFFEYDGYMYWFRGDVPPGIILKTTELKKQFSYKEYKEHKDEDYVTPIYDPTVWFLRYNRQTGKVTVEDVFRG